MNAILLLVAKLLAGWLIADALGGFVHWIEDRVLTERVPLLGRHVVAPNRRHHAEPMAFASGSLVERNGTTWAAAALASLLWLWIAGPSVIWAAATLGGAVSSHVHYLAHLPKNGPRFVRVLQEIGLLQSPVHHAGHHRPPSDRRYCVLTDWLNPVLDAVGIWALLERGLRRVGLPIEADR